MAPLTPPTSLASLTSLAYTQVVTDCFEIEDGFDTKAFQGYQERISFACLRLAKQIEDLQLPAVSIANQDKDLAQLEELAISWQEKFDHIIVLGTGGSSSGGAAALGLRLRNENPRITFVDTVSVGPFETLLADLDWEKTGFLTISKSGSTGETLAQCLIVLQELIERDLTRNMLVLTEATNNPLRGLAEAHNMPCLEHDSKIGGRFSVFSPVGMLPAMMAGLDVRRIRRGASAVLKDVLDNRAESQAAIGACIAVYAYKEGYKPLQVFMPYIERLKPLSLWFRQLWAECF